MKLTRVLVATLALSLGACNVSDEGEKAGSDAEASPDLNPEGPSILSKLVGGGKPMAIDVQQAHPNGLVLQLNSLQAKPTETVVAATIINGDDSENSLNKYNNKNTYLVGADGAKLYLSPPLANQNLDIPPGQRMTAELVFLGRLSADGPATLIVNDGSNTDNEHTSQPAFRIPVPLDSAAFSDDGSKKN